MKDGCPAFPTDRVEHLGDEGGSSGSAATVTYPGMSLLDHFAGQALAGMMTRHTPGSGSCERQDHAAWDAYSVARAMLAEREKAK